jgi:hypothetical protein
MLANRVMPLAGLIWMIFASVVCGQNPFSETQAGDEISMLRAKSRSRVILDVNPGESVEILLYAADETDSTLTASYCGGDVGDKEFSGTYKLLSIKNDKIISEIALNALEFSDRRKPYDGITIEELAGKKLIAIYQYGGCDGLSAASFFRVNSAGELSPVNFVLRGEKTLTEIVGCVSVEKDLLVLGHHDSRLGRTLYDGYEFNGTQFVQKESWIDENTFRGRARWALYDFLSALNKGDFNAAGNYYDDGKLKRRSPEDNGPSGPLILADYCGTVQSLCPEASRILDISDDVSFSFAVSFGGKNSESLGLDGIESYFVFRAVRQNGKIKIFGLPPRVQEK